MPAPPRHGSCPTMRSCTARTCGALSPCTPKVPGLSATHVRAVQLRIVGQLPCLGGAGIEPLRWFTVGYPMALEQLAPAFGQGDERRAAVAVNRRDAANEVLAAQMLQIPVTEIPRASGIIAEVARRHDPKRPDRRQRARLGPAHVVRVVLHIEPLALPPTGQVEAGREDVARVEFLGF